jgi:hypothetical protein
MLKKLAFAGALCCSIASPLYAQTAATFTPFANVQTATLSAAALPSLGVANGAVLKADYSNTGTIYLGPCATLTTANGYPLKAGEAVSYGSVNYAGDLSRLCMIGVNTTDKLYFTGN